MALYQKIQYYRSQIGPEFAPYVDKIEAKRLVKELGGDLVEVAPLVRVLSGPDDLCQSDLRSDVMIKASHGCGWNINVTPATNLVWSINKLRSWNKVYEGHEEPHYKYIKPRFFIERKINDAYTGYSGNAVVFLIRCLHGEPFAIGVRNGNKQNSYSVDWEPLKPLEMPHVEKPPAFEKLLAVARKLSAPFEFVRVDLYIGADNTIYFSEFTFTPSAGSMFYSIEKERSMGALWK
jgi:hypothetical protein